MIGGWLNSPWAALWTAALLHFLWQGTLLTGLAALILALRPARWRYPLLVAVFALMTVCPPATVFWLARSENFIHDDVTAITRAPDVSFDVLPPLAADRNGSPAAADAIDAATDPSAHRSLGVWLPTSFAALQPLLLVLWIAGAAALLMRLACGAAAVAVWVRAARSAPSSWNRIVETFQRRLRFSARIRVLISETIREPMALWCWRPAILLPAAWLAEVPPDVLESVLAHELIHLRRWDLWVNFYQRFGETVLFYHPGVWWLSRRIRLEREICCDAAAVELVGKPVRYARALEFVARQRLDAVRPILATGMGGTDMTLLGRIQRVLGVETPRRFTDGWSWGLAFAAMLVVGGLMAVASSRDVSGEETRDSAVGVSVAEGDQDDPPRRPDGPRDEPRPAGAEGEPPRDAGPPQRGPRERGGPGRDRGPRRGPPPGDFRDGGGPRGGDPLRELMDEIRALREEVAQLREEVRSLRGGPIGPDRELRGPGRPRDGRGPREGDAGPGPRGRGPGRPEGERRGPPPEAGRGREPRDGFGPPRDDLGRDPDGRRGPPPEERRDQPREDRPQRPPEEESARGD